MRLDRAGPDVLLDFDFNNFGSVGTCKNIILYQFMKQVTRSLTGDKKQLQLQVLQFTVYNLQIILSINVNVNSI